MIINSRDAIDGKGNIELNLDSATIVPQECTSCHKMFSGKYVSLSVSDTGCGISSNIVSRIFDPFFTTKLPGQGSGMGLAIIHGFVHSSGGHIHIDTNNTGTVFTLLFPHCEQVASNSVRNKPTSNIASDRKSHSTRHILVVDDEIPVVKILTEILELEDYKVTSTSSSNKALQLVKDGKHDYDLLITDHTMPELTGVELIEEVRKLKPDIPTILCSGYTKESHDAHFDNQEISRIMTKPVDQLDLVNLVAELVDKGT